MTDCSKTILPILLAKCRSKITVCLGCCVKIAGTIFTPNSEGKAGYGSVRVHVVCCIFLTYNSFYMYFVAQNETFSHYSVCAPHFLKSESFES